MILISRIDIIGPYVASRCNCPLPADGATALGLWDGKVVAGVMYERFTGKSVVASIAVDDPKRLTREWLWAIFDYPFNQLGVSKILVHVCSSNEASAHLARRFGFKTVAVVPEVYEDGDMIIMELVRNDCKWLEKPHGTKGKDPEGT